MTTQTANTDAQERKYRRWYHRIEVAQDVFSGGAAAPLPVGLTRKALTQIDVRGQNCIDVGCMEGFMSILMHRQGAKTVTAYDRLDKCLAISEVKTTYDVDFSYISGPTLSQLPLVAKQKLLSPFDVVIFSGVLYHVIDPLGSLLRVRDIARVGGTVIIETSVVVDTNCGMYFNPGQNLQKPPNLFTVTSAGLDVMLRFCGLEPKDVYFFSYKKDQATRTAVICEVLPHRTVALGGSWDMNMQMDLAEFQVCENGQADPMTPICKQRAGLPVSEHGGISIHQTMAEGQAEPRDLERATLRLNDQA